MSTPARRLTGWVLTGLLVLAGAPAAAQRAADSGAATRAVPIIIGQSVLALNGPWRFHTGDEPRWADPSFDDSAWEQVDLTPHPGAHDPDVGLTGYVPGWGARGHAGVSGYAWYRMRVSAQLPPGATLALAGPLEVNDAYQLFVNGKLVGHSGRFIDSTPIVYSTRPQIFVLGDSLAPPTNATPEPLVIAFRVWVSASAMRAPDAGGIRIAPELGELGAVSARIRLEWLAKFLGYVVEVVEGAVFVLLAVMTCIVALFDPANRAYRWLAAALVITGLARANQAIFFWTQWESLHRFVIIRSVTLTPLALGAWAMAWRGWFGLRRPAWLPQAIAGLTLLYVATNLVAVAGLNTTLSHAVSATIRTSSLLLRLSFVLVMAVTWGQAAAHREPSDRLALLATLLVSAGLFAQELSAIGIPGIWFPYGVGVSRTQYVLAAFAVLAFAELARRLRSFARAGRARMQLTSPA